MDIQEIARLHTRYTEPPLTIEMPTEDRATPLLDGPGPMPAAEPKPIWARLTEAQRLVVALLVVAGIAFPIGMWAASAGKHDGNANTAKVQSAETAASAASAPDSGGHEWPPKTAQTTTEPPPANAIPQGSRATHPGNAAQPVASMASAASAPDVTPPARAAAAPAPNKVAEKAPTSASKSATATAQTMAPAPSPAQAAHAVEPRRSNEIKLF